MRKKHLKRSHFLRADFSNKWTEVTKERYLQAEKDAGFCPKDPSFEYATAGFSTDEICGRYLDEGRRP